MNALRRLRLGNLRRRRRRADGSIRPAAREVMDAVLAQDLATLAAGVREEIAALGITLRVGRRRRELARRPGPARDPERRVGARRGRPRAARESAQRVRRRRLRGPADRRRGRAAAARARQRRERRAGDGGRAPARRRLDRHRRPRPRARRATASGSCSRTTCARRAGSRYWAAARDAVLRGLDVPTASRAARRHPRSAAPRVRRRPRGRDHRRAGQRRLLGARLDRPRSSGWRS